MHTSEWEDVTKVIVVTILAHHVAFMSFSLSCQVVPECRDVNKETSLGVHPAPVNDIHVIGGAIVGVMRIDLEHIVASIRDPGKLKMVHGHVVVFRKMVHGLHRHLHVDVGIPWHDLSIPEPAKQTAMHDPCFRSNVVHCREICLHEWNEMCFLVFIAQGFLSEAAIVMGMKASSCQSMARIRVIETSDECTLLHENISLEGLSSWL